MVEGEMLLNAYGKIAKEEWQNTSEIRDNVALHEFVVMPNIFHAILEITFQKGNNEVGKFQSPSQTIGSMIKGYKIATIKKIKDFILSLEEGDLKMGEPTGELKFAPTAPEPTQRLFL